MEIIGICQPLVKLQDIPIWIVLIVFLMRPGRISRIVRQMRLGQKLTRTHLALALNVSENYLYTIEVGQKMPSLAFVLRFAEYFGINPILLKGYWLNDYLSYMERKIKRKIGMED